MKNKKKLNCDMYVSWQVWRH